MANEAMLKNVTFGTPLVLSVGGKKPNPDTGDVPITSGAYPTYRVDVNLPVEGQEPTEIRLKDKTHNVIEFASDTQGLYVVDFLTTVALPDKNTDGSLRSFTVSVLVNSTIPAGAFALPFAGPRYGNACKWSAGRTVTTFAAKTSYSFAYSEIEEDKWDVKCTSLSSDAAKWYENPVVFGRTRVTTMAAPIPVPDGCAGFNGGIDQHGSGTVSVSFGYGGTTAAKPTVLTGFSRLFSDGAQPSFPNAFREVIKDSADVPIRGSAVSTAALGDFNWGVQLFGRATAGGIRVMPLDSSLGDKPMYEVHAYVPKDGTNVEITPDAIEISADGTKVYMNAYTPSSLRNSIYEFDIANSLKSGQDTDFTFVKEHPVGTRVRRLHMFGNKLFVMADDAGGEPARWWAEDLSKDSGFVCVAEPICRADDIFVIDQSVVGGSERHLYYCTKEKIYGFNLREDGLWHDGTMFMAPVSLAELGVCAGSSGNQLFVSKDETKMIFASNSSVAFDVEGYLDRHDNDYDAYPVVFGFVGAGRSATKLGWCDIQHPDTFPANKESIVSFLQERLSGLDDTATIRDVISALTSTVARGK